LKRNNIIANIILTLLIFSIFNAYSKDHPISLIDCNEDEWVARVEKAKNKIIASSVHVTEGKYNYIPENLVDNKTDTCWCPDNNGINQFVIIKIPKKSKGFRISNGVGKSKQLYYENNRVKTLYWALISERIYESEEEMENDSCRARDPNLKYGVAFQTPPGLKLIQIIDTPEPQKILFKNYEYFSWELNNLKKSQNVYLVISITDIYKGSKYNDTCISEIEIIP
jgi:hypothetical protein